jgi:nucleotide-binding universal stress UspA family protein
VEVWANVLEGAVADGLVAHARFVKSSLIVLTSHGRGPFSRFWLGSIADEMLRRGPVPLLVQRPTENGLPPIDRDWRPRQILIPLDGSPWSEAIIGPAIELARLMEAGITLLHVVEPIPVLFPDGPVLEVDKVLQEVKTKARTNLELIAERLRKDGISVLTRLACDTRVATAILEESCAFDLMALATHGRSTLARVVLGSVADKLVRGAEGPVLVVHPIQK